MIGIQPTKFGIFFKVLNIFGIIGFVGIRENPAHVGVPKPLGERAMNIFVLIREPMMITMMTRPP